MKQRVSMIYIVETLINFNIMSDYKKDIGVSIDGRLFSSDFDEVDKHIQQEIQDANKDDSDAEMEEHFGLNNN